MFRRFSVSLISIFITASATAQSYRSDVTSAYIERFYKTAIKDMYEYKIPASITLAQGILESGSGRSDLATEANNHFGIKCTSDYNGKKFFKDDDKKNDCFRVYADAAESYRDHALFLTQRKHYAPLFELKTTDYKGWAKGLKKCGYATNPKYPELLIAVIEQNDLQRFDKNPEKYLKEDDYKINGTTDVIAPNPTPSVVNGSINGVECITIKPGDTFYGLSKRYNKSIEALKKINDFPEDYVLKAGETFFVKKKKKKFKAAKYHVVQKGETLLSISQAYGIRKRSLMKMNKLNSEPAVGSKLVLN